MAGFLREHSWPVLCSVLLHAALAAALVLMTMNFATRSPTIVQPDAINAVVVDSQVLHAARRAQVERAAEEAQRARAAADAQAASKAAAASQAAEAAKAAAAAKAADDAKALEQARAAEQAKAAEHARAEAARAAEEQAQAKAAAAKQAQELKRAVDEHARQERESELHRQLAEEEHIDAVEASPLRDRYIASLRNSIQKAWIKPPSARVGVDCLVEVTQVPGGEVTTVRITQCNG